MVSFRDYQQEAFDNQADERLATALTKGFSIARQTEQNLKAIKDEREARKIIAEGGSTRDVADATGSPSAVLTARAEKLNVLKQSQEYQKILTASLDGGEFDETTPDKFNEDITDNVGQILDYIDDEALYLQAKTQFETVAANTQRQHLARFTEKQRDNERKTALDGLRPESDDIKTRYSVLKDDVAKAAFLFDAVNIAPSEANYDFAIKNADSADDKSKFIVSRETFRRNEIKKAQQAAKIRSDQASLEITKVAFDDEQRAQLIEDTLFQEQYKFGDVLAPNSILTTLTAAEIDNLSKPMRKVVLRANTLRETFNTTTEAVFEAGGIHTAQGEKAFSKNMTPELSKKYYTYMQHQAEQQTDQAVQDAYIGIAMQGKTPAQIKTIHKGFIDQMLSGTLDAHSQKTNANYSQMRQTGGIQQYADDLIKRFGPEVIPQIQSQDIGKLLEFTQSDAVVDRLQRLDELKAQGVKAINPATLSEDNLDLLAEGTRDTVLMSALLSSDPELIRLWHSVEDDKGRAVDRARVIYDDIHPRVQHSTIDLGAGVYTASDYPISQALHANIPGLLQIPDTNQRRGRIEAFMAKNAVRGHSNYLARDVRRQNEINKGRLLEVDDNGDMLFQIGIQEVTIPFNSGKWDFSKVYEGE